MTLMSKILEKRQGEIKRNLSIKLFSDHTGIHRATAKERMESIYNKLRKQNK